MPVKLRVAKGRRPRFSSEALQLFAGLEGTPRAKAFGAETHRLANLLGLTEEWWTGNHVNDASSAPLYPPGYQSFVDWLHCRAVRGQLLAALKESS